MRGRPPGNVTLGATGPPSSPVKGLTTNRLSPSTHQRAPKLPPISLESRKKTDGQTARRPDEMPAPSRLAIASSSVLRLLKEEVSYHKELVDEEAKIKILEERVKSGQDDEEGNGEFMLKQQVCLPSHHAPLLFPSPENRSSSSISLPSLLLSSPRVPLSAETSCGRSSFSQTFASVAQNIG